jgi:O-antigen/teichoic acid export membrane protein
MTTAKRVVKNSIWLLIGNVVLRVISAFIIVMLARNFGAEIFGQFSFALSFVSFFALFSSFGFNSLMIRDVARKKSLAPKYINNILSIKVIFCLISLLALFIISRYIGKPESLIIVIYILGIQLVVTSFSESLRSLFHAYQRMEFDALNKIVEKTLWAGLILLVINGSLSLVNVALAILLSAVFGLIITYFIVRVNITKVRFELDKKFCIGLVIAAAPFALTELFSLINFRIDQIMLSFMTTDALVGIYSASYKIIDILAVVPNMLLASLYPVFSSYFSTNKAAFHKSFNLAIRYVTIMSFPIVIGVYMLANQLVYLLYGSEYMDAVPVLRLLIFISLVSFINTPLFVVLNAMGKQKITMINTAFTALVNITMNAILIPILSIKGAAIATIASEITFLALSMYQLRKSGIKFNIFKHSIRPLIAGIIMGALIWHYSYINLFILVPAAAMLYFGVLISLKEFGKEDLEMVKKVFMRRSR